MIKHNKKKFGSKKQPSTHSQIGFTLIELLVIIAIIGVLSSVVMTALSIARYKARDAKRIQDLRTIATALELYYNDNGNYPTPTADYWSSGDSSSTYGWQNLSTALTPYISQLPVDPKNSGGVIWGGPTAYTYVYGFVGTNSAGKKYYSLLANLEDPKSPYRCEVQTYKWHYHNSGVTLCNNGGPGGWSYTIMGYQASHSIF